MPVNIKTASQRAKQNEPQRNGREKDLPDPALVFFSIVLLPLIEVLSVSPVSTKKPLLQLALTLMITHGKLKYSVKSVIFVINYLL